MKRKKGDEEDAGRERERERGMRQFCEAVGFGQAFFIMLR